MSSNCGGRGWLCQAGACDPARSAAQSGGLTDQADGGRGGASALAARCLWASHIWVSRALASRPAVGHSLDHAAPGRGPLPQIQSGACNGARGIASAIWVADRADMTAHDIKRSHRRAALRRRRVVAVIGSGTEAHRNVCRQVGRLVAEMGCDLLTGAGGGVMEEVSRAFCERRDQLGGASLAIGIVPGSLDADGRYTVRSRYPNRWVELAIYTHLPLSGNEGRHMLSRNHINVLSADAIVALPG